MRNHFIANGEIEANGKKGENSLLKEINPEYSLEGLRLSSNTLATWCEEPTYWKKPWANSRSLWRTGKPGMLQSMGSQRVRHVWLNKNNSVLKEYFMVMLVSWAPPPRPQLKGKARLKLQSLMPFPFSSILNCLLTHFTICTYLTFSTTY